MAPAPRAALLVVAAATLLGRAVAEVYQVDKEVVASWTLAAKHLFYVDATPAGHSKGNALAHEEDFAEVLFEDFRVSVLSREAKPQQDSWTLQVGIISWTSFDELLDPQSFCGTNGNILLRNTGKDGDKGSSSSVKVVGVPVGKTVTKQMRVEKTGVYVVVLASCGATEDLQISGTISVRGQNGFLPANKQFSLPLFGWCLVGYIVAGVVWVAFLASHKSDLHEPHYAIASFIAFGIGEAACYWYYLSEMNETGESLVWLEKLCQSMTIMKTAYLFAVVMLLCFGVGLTQAEEYANVSWKLLGVTTLFSAALAPKVCVFDYRPTKNLSQSDTILSIIPALVVTIVSLAWGTKGIAKTMTRCKDLNYAGTLKLLQRLVVVILLLLLATVGILAAQLMDKPGRDQIWWQFHMFWSETAGELIHLMVLVALMVLCKPDQAVFMATAYAPSQGEGGEMKGVPCAQEDDEEEAILNEAESRTGSPSAEKIGATAAAE